MVEIDKEITISIVINAPCLINAPSPYCQMLFSIASRHLNFGIFAYILKFWYNLPTFCNFGILPTFCLKNVIFRTSELQRPGHLLEYGITEKAFLSVLRIQVGQFSVTGESICSQHLHM